MQIGFIGLGRMGSAMAANLPAAGHDVTVYNRTEAKAEHLVKRGEKLAQTPGHAERGQFVITMLATTVLSNRRYSQRTESSPR
jgi:3-hydroxyisobutyrate dehydrogenase-like beta-hydroxyacid dehydrogenase